MLIVSPGWWITTSDRRIRRLSAKIFQRLSEVVVSSGTLSLRAMSIMASSNLAPFISMDCLSRSIPLLDNARRLNRPFTRAASTNCAVLNCTLLTSKVLIMTLLSSSGNNCTSTTIRSTSAIVSVFWIIWKPSIPKSMGKERST